MERKELRLSGSGGQGIILAGIILAEAALYDGLEVVQSQSYGPEARGGASRAEVIISKGPINYPKVNKCDILLALTQLSCDKYLNSLKKEGTLIIDSSVELPERDDIKIYQVPIIDTANNILNRPMVANIVALGAIYQATNIISKTALEKAVFDRVPKGTQELNKLALTEGFLLIKSEGK